MNFFDALEDDQLVLPFEVETLTPEEMGWVRLPGGIDYTTYEMPNGELYVFGPLVPRLIKRFKRGV